jgi:hypothetical protein
MADPKQVCYLCERSLDAIGRASEITDQHGNPIGNPGVCVECEEQNNPVLRAQRRMQRQAQGMIPPPEEQSTNPLLSKKTVKPTSPFGNMLQGYQGPQAPLSQPPRPMPSGDDMESENPLNG